MKKKNTTLETDVEQLAKRSITAEVEDKVWSALDHAIAGLDEASQALLNEYFNGTTVAELSERHGLRHDQMEAWIVRSKRELIKRLRSKCTVRQ